MDILLVSSIHLNIISEGGLITVYILIKKTLVLMWKFVFKYILSYLHVYEWYKMQNFMPVVVAYVMSKNCCSTVDSNQLRRGSESGALSLSSAARHVDFHSSRRIYVILVAHSIVLSLHLAQLGWARDEARGTSSLKLLSRSLAVFGSLPSRCFGHVSRHWLARARTQDKRTNWGRISLSDNATRLSPVSI